MSIHSNIVWHELMVSKKDRHIQNGHKSCVLWFTGLSGSGKSTLANAVDYELFKNHYYSYVLDGDNIRHGLNKDLGFQEYDRKENIRRIGEVAKLFVDSGIIVSTAFISPFQEDRNRIREMFAQDEFIEIYLQCPIQVCEKRDPKGLYSKARKGEIPHFTGISSPYEKPQNPEIIIDTNQLSIHQSVQKVLAYLKEKQLLP
ncbi:adenylyl-sulfate kinase [Caldibacillus lycopersici]|uniref:Adenylyl-sulfate kinase n=1 Tax=Perspicuibacillus lycopersici TaxID=1325689 RepID=A0AAE3IUB0_9BACI|nr:adenylyl-sulfate kinase [Perspicuibacillus lycopersici]MCU9614738.1 adenylyl-sulfate kinase [Perspicuibacillus lycopersici]